VNFYSVDILAEFSAFVKRFCTAFYKYKRRGKTCRGVKNLKVMRF